MVTALAWVVLMAVKGEGFNHGPAYQLFTKRTRLI